MLNDKKSYLSAFYEVASYLGWTDVIDTKTELLKRKLIRSFIAAVVTKESNQ